MTTTIARPAKDTPETEGLLRITPLMEARALQRLIYDKASRTKCTDSALASLARSWCLVQDCIRVMRGIPSPGQLRPDLDPVQLTKALKRARSRKPILDMATGPFEAPNEAPAPNPKAKSPSHTKPLPQEKTNQETAEQPTTDQEPKESLSEQGTVTTEPGAEGAE